MISAHDVEYIAHLARIHLEQDEIESLTRDLESILFYINKLEKLATTKTEPTSHVLAFQNVSRADTVQPSLNHNELMNFAVSQKNGNFLVPMVIES